MRVQEDFAVDVVILYYFYFLCLVFCSMRLGKLTKAFGFGKGFVFLCFVLFWFCTSVLLYIFFKSHLNLSPPVNCFYS